MEELSTKFVSVSMLSILLALSTSLTYLRYVHHLTHSTHLLTHVHYAFLQYTPNSSRNSLPGWEVGVVGGLPAKTLPV